MIISPSKKKTLKLTLFLVSFLILVVLVGGYEFMKSRVPQMSGVQSLKGLSAPVEVLRDQNGIPHITASNTIDAARALGYLMASERLFQMEVSRRLSQGELAEVLGERLLNSDKLFRNLGLKRESKKLIEKKLKNNLFDPQMLKEAEAYYDGVNQFIETGPMPLEFILLGIKPKPFSMIDGQSFIGMMAFNFGIATMAEPLLTELVSRIGPELVEDLRNEKIASPRVLTTDAHGDISRQVVNVLRDLEDGFSLFEGSNGWLLSAQRSQSGFPIFANDPHITYTHPGIWFEAHVKTPTYESYGHYLSLIPFPVLSHNRERAWGLTMSLTDDMDLYQENLDEKNQTYFFKGNNLPLKINEEIIKIKNADDHRLLVSETHHGPILIADEKNKFSKKSLSLQWAFYHPDNDPLSAIYQMGRAKTMQEFKMAVSTGKAPGLNILYADKDNIGWWIFGEIWRKRAGLKTDFILNGSSGEDEILSSLRFEEKPSSENPESGVIISANSRPAQFPREIRGDWQADDRYKTIEQILSQKEKWSPDELMELQSLSMNFENKLILEVLLSETHFQNISQKNQYQKYLDVLSKWNFISETSSVEASIYYTWTNQILLNLLDSLNADEKEIFAKIPNGWIFFKRLVFERDSIWWKKYDRASVFRESFIKTISRLEDQLGSDFSQWHWGKLHTLEFSHPIGRIKPLNYFFNLGPFPTPGANHEVNNQKSTSFKEGFKIKAGPSTRRIIDFSRPEKSWGILPAGNSGHILSPFYSNQAQLFLAGKYRDQLLDLNPEDIRFKMQFEPN